MFEEGELVDIPIVWEEVIAAQEPAVARTSEKDKVLELESEKEAEKRGLVQAWARALVQNAELESKIRELEVKVRNLQNENQVKSEKAKKEVIPNKGGGDHHSRKLKEPCQEEDSSGSSRNFKRKWRNDKYKSEGSQPKKRKIGACASCGKSHSGVCQKGKNVCYRCGQGGHFAPNCLNPKKNQGCFKCGSLDHQIKNCPMKGKARGMLDPTGHD